MSLETTQTTDTPPPPPPPDTPEPPTTAETTNNKTETTDVDRMIDEEQTGDDEDSDGNAGSTKPPPETERNETPHTQKTHENHNIHTDENTDANPPPPPDTPPDTPPNAVDQPSNFTPRDEYQEKLAALDPVNEHNTNESRVIEPSPNNTTDVDHMIDTEQVAQNKEGGDTASSSEQVAQPKIDGVNEVSFSDRATDVDHTVANEPPIDSSTESPPRSEDTDLKHTTERAPDEEQSPGGPHDDKTSGTETIQEARPDAEGMEPHENNEPDRCPNDLLEPSIVVNDKSPDDGPPSYDQSGLGHADLVLDDEQLLDDQHDGRTDEIETYEERPTAPSDETQIDSNGNTESARVEQTRPAVDAYHGRIATASAEHRDEKLSPITTGSENLPLSRPVTDTSAEFSDRLRSYLDESEVTAAGRAFYELHDTAMRQAAHDVPPEPGMYTIDMHGDTVGVYIGGELLSPANLGAMLEHDPNWKGEPVQLFACETGRDRNGFAQLLADHLNVDVTAPTELVWSEPDGKTYVTPTVEVDIFGNPIPKLPPEGKWEDFHPRTMSYKEI